MTTVQTRVVEICNTEGFNIKVKENGIPVDETENGKMGSWPHTNKTKGTKSVSDFRDKFEKAYPGLSCDVLYGNKEEAHGNTLLRQVRGSY